MLCDFQLLPIVACAISGVSLASSYITYMCVTKPDVRYVISCIIIVIIIKAEYQLSG